MAQAQGLRTERAYMQTTFTCPKCGAVLQRSGEVEIGTVALPVFQCDACTVDWELGGEVEQVAYTFAVSPDGVAFDPASDELPSLGS
jgi:transcription elongation factor Elf1